MVFIVGGAGQGKTEYAQAHFVPQCRIMNQYHLTVREQLESGQDPLAQAKKLLEQEDDNLVIISDEVGCGLVPLEAFEREYREMVGRVNCYLAAEAQQVIRVICGIGQRIRG